MKHISSLVGLIVFLILAVGSTDDSSSSSSSSSASICKLDGCNRSGNGWRYYTGSDLPSYRYTCVRLGPSTGHSYNYTFCSRDHCIQGK